jgi:hypothetical protein
VSLTDDENVILVVNWGEDDNVSEASSDSDTLKETCCDTDPECDPSIEIEPLDVKEMLRERDDDNGALRVKKRTR